MADVLVLNQYYPPDTAVTGAHAHAIARRLADEGLQVTALVGQPSYGVASNAPPGERLDGVDVVRVPLGRRRGRERLVDRLTGYVRYLAAAGVRGRRRPADLIVVFHNPPFLALVAAALARRTGARLLYVPQDIHPDIVQATAWLDLPAPVFALWDALSRRMLHAADATVVLGEGMRRTLVDGKGADPDTVHVIPLWAEPELDVRPRDSGWRRDHGLGDELVVLHSGNMGLMQPLEPVFDAAAELDPADVRFVLAGEGVRREHWQREAQRRGLGHVEFVPFHRGEDYARLVAAADVAVVSLREGMERLSVPSRTFPLLAAGRPVIAMMAADADVAVLLRETGAGWHVRDAGELAALLRRLVSEPDLLAAAGARARGVFEQRFTRDVVTRSYVDLARRLLATTP